MINFNKKILDVNDQILSTLFMYFFKGLGIEIDPSSFWLFSSIAINNLPTAKPEPFNVPIKSKFFSRFIFCFHSSRLECST